MVPNAKQCGECQVNSDCSGNQVCNQNYLLNNVTVSKCVDCMQDQDCSDKYPTNVFCVNSTC